jgi:hypothetical protein
MVAAMRKAKRNADWMHERLMAERAAGRAGRAASGMVA